MKHKHDLIMQLYMFEGLCKYSYFTKGVISFWRTQFIFIIIAFHHKIFKHVKKVLNSFAQKNYDLVVSEEEEEVLLTKLNCQSHVKKIPMRNASDTYGSLANSGTAISQEGQFLEEVHKVIVIDSGYMLIKTVISDATFKMSLHCE